MQILRYNRAMSRITTSTAQVIKIAEFRGRLSTRPLYIYLPPGYAEETERYYPILYMHDGQNCFQAYVEDSYVGSWRADEVASQLIERGEIDPCIIVGVSNGGEDRVLEYLPDYVPYQVRRPRLNTRQAVAPVSTHGQATKTLSYYRNDVDAYMQQHYRVLPGRAHRATCGSSLGGLFSAYIAWEHSQFARSHAIMSPSFWITSRRPGSRTGPFETIERFRSGEPREVRLWLDSGTDSVGGTGNDGMLLTQQARDALLANGYVQGENLCYYLHEGGAHNEASWSQRLDKVLRYLFPPRRG